MLTKGYKSFEVIGNVTINGFTFRLNESSKKSTFTYNVMDLIAYTGNENRILTKLLGGFRTIKDKLYVFGVIKDEFGMKKTNYSDRFAIDWEDRFDADLLRDVSEDCFIKISIDLDEYDDLITQKFLSEYDAINYLSKNLKDNMKLHIRGEIRYSKHEGTVFQQNHIKTIKLVHRNTENKAVFKQSVLFKNDFEERFLNEYDEFNGMYTSNGFVVDYCGKEKELRTFPIELKSETSLKDIINLKQTREFVVEGRLIDKVVETGIIVNKVKEMIVDSIS